jgi:hypothetical protein
MNNETFTANLASISELADRWDVQLHQLAYIVRSRKIPCERVAGTTRLFNMDQQKAIHAVLHKYLPNQGSLLLARTIPELSEQEELQKDQLIEAVETLRAKNQVLEARIASLEADIVLLKRIVALEEAVSQR